MPNENTNYSIHFTSLHREPSKKRTFASSSTNSELFQHMEMESLLTKPTYGGIKRYLRRRRYQHPDGGATTGRKKMKIIRLRRSPRHWRIRAIPRLRWVMRSPLKEFTKLKKAYMSFMLWLAGKVRAMNTNIFGGKRIPKARQVSEGYSIDDFEARLIYEISKALVAGHELYPM